MIQDDTVFELLLYLLLYSFLGWTVGVACIALKDGRFVNRGLLNLPLSISEGITAVILLLVLPTMEKHPIIQFLMTWVIVFVMLCNGLLTSLAMQRYTLRQTRPELTNFIEEFLDERYDDDWMESRWPNMKLT